MSNALIPVIQEVFRQPPIPYEPAKHSLKLWATYCLRDRGFKVGYAERADFKVESKRHGTIYFNVTSQPSAELSDSVGWIIWDDAQTMAQVIPPANL